MYRHCSMFDERSRIPSSKPRSLMLSALHTASAVIVLLLSIYSVSDVSLPQRGGKKEVEGANSHQYFSLVSFSISLPSFFFNQNEKGYTRRGDTSSPGGFISRASASAYSPLRVSVNEKLDLGGLEDRHSTEADSVGRFLKREMMINNILARLQEGTLWRVSPGHIVRMPTRKEEKRRP